MEEFFGGAEARRHRRYFSWVGWAMVAALGGNFLLQSAAAGLLSLVAPQLLREPWVIWGISIVSLYAVAFPLSGLLLRRLPPGRQLERHPLGPAELTGTYFTALGVLYLSNLVTLVLTGWLQEFTGQPVSDPVDSMLNQPVWLNILLSCLLAPLAEEWLFRGVLLSRLRPYGDRFAMVASALLFAMMHGNLSQLLYAFGVGLVLARVVLKTGCLWQTVVLHALVNLVAVGLAPLAAQLGELGAELLSMLIFFSIGFAAFQLVLSWRWRKPPAPEERGEGPAGELECAERWSYFLVNPGMTVYVGLVLLFIWIYLVMG